MLFICMADIKNVSSMIKEERNASKKYKRLAEYNRKYGKKEDADIYEKLSKSENAHAKKLTKVYKM